MRISPGDLLVAFTDGISEAMNLEDEEWGEDRLLDSIRGCHGKNGAGAAGVCFRRGYPIRRRRAAA